MTDEVFTNSNPKARHRHPRNLLKASAILITWMSLEISIGKKHQSTFNQQQAFTNHYLVVQMVHGTLDSKTILQKQPLVKFACFDSSFSVDGKDTKTFFVFFLFHWQRFLIIENETDDELICGSVYAHTLLHKILSAWLESLYVSFVSSQIDQQRRRHKNQKSEA